MATKEASDSVFGFTVLSPSLRCDNMDPQPPCFRFLALST